MIKRILFIALVFSFYLGNAQQLPHYSLYMWNHAVLNPAAISAKKQNEINLMARNQWVGFAGAPKTQSVSYYNINRFKFNAGTNILYDQTGPISILRASLDGSYIIPLENNENELSVGLSANLLQYKIDNSLITLENDGVLDPAMLNEMEKVLSHRLGAGIFYYNDKFYVGISTSSIINKKLDVQLNNELIGHYYLQGGYHFSLGGNYKVSPSILVKTIGAVPPQLDAGTKFSYNDMISFGVTYRSSDALVALFGLDFGAYSFGYGYDVTTSAMKHPSSGSHELILTYRFETVERDTDKDGVIDKIDECPNKKGLIENNGCPDYDKDGIIDKNDKCPKVPGLKIHDGCPDGDNDGVIDEQDKCPDIPGLKGLSGCPDRDKDGVRDGIDRCPDIPGIWKYLGCPDTLRLTDTIYKPVIIRDTIIIKDTTIIRIEQREEGRYLLPVKNIYFDHDKANIKQESKLTLDEVVEILNDYPNVKLRIEAHTSNPGSANWNKNLSKSRANSVKLYLENSGITSSRLKTKAYGEELPIADNNTKAGQAKNRRVEFFILD